MRTGAELVFDDGCFDGGSEQAGPRGAHHVPGPVRRVVLQGAPHGQELVPHDVHLSGVSISPRCYEKEWTGRGRVTMLCSSWSSSGFLGLLKMAQFSR